MKRITIAIIAGLFFGIVTVAQAEQYVDPTGFSFTYPGGWTAIANPATAKLPADLKARFEKVRNDLGVVSVLLLHRNNQRDAYEAIAVGAVDGSSVIGKFSLAELRSLIPKKLAARGMSCDGLKIEVQPVGANEAIVAEFDTHPPNDSTPIHECLFFFSSRGKTYLVACAANAQDFERFTPVFGQVALSFRMPKDNGR